ncbi:MAG: hypothetical protein JNK35_04120, partial [Phycisphaerae bacterium]|nr:hypothetical protein [Phycisphaerae bacterium]
DLPSDQRMLPTMVYIADRLAAGAKMGFCLDCPSGEVDDAALDQIHLTREQLNAIAAELPEQVKDVERLLTQ